jgi:hypothetical protein
VLHLDEVQIKEEAMAAASQPVTALESLITHLETAPSADEEVDEIGIGEEGQEQHLTTYL